MTTYETGQESSLHNYFSKWVTLVQDAAPKIVLDIDKPLSKDEDIY